MIGAIAGEPARLEATISCHRGVKLGVPVHTAPSTLESMSGMSRKAELPPKEPSDSPATKSRGRVSGGSRRIRR